MARALRILLLVASVAVAAWVVARMWRGLAQVSAVDFYLVWVNVHVAGRDDIPNIYSDEAQGSIGEEFFARSLDSRSRVFHETATNRRRLDSRGSPFLYASFAWVSADFETALMQFRVLVIASCLAGMILLGRYCGLPLWFSIGLFAATVYYYLPFIADFIVANVNAIQLFLLALALMLGERRPMLAGALLAMMLAQKPNVVLVVAVLMLSRVLTRDFRRLRQEVLGGAIGGVLAFAIGSWWFETPRIWLLWLGSAGDLYETLLGVEYNNVTPALPLFQQHGTWLSYVIAAVLLVVACIPLLRGAKRDDLLLISLGLLIYFMSATLVWLHYLVLCFIPAFAMLRTRTTAAIAFVALLLMADVPYAMYFGPSTPQLRAKLIFAALVLLYASCVALLWRGRGVRVPAARAAHPAL
ncbi:MAG TPA: hypothetical protein VF432_29935 [Thermoanaerobaculia bacterium]